MFKLLSENARLNLLEYLQNHESDIAHGINDFALLRGLFITVFKREPKG
jgi:hypothetical protein